MIICKTFTLEEGFSVELEQNAGWLQFEPQPYKHGHCITEFRLTLDDNMITFKTQVTSFLQKHLLQEAKIDLIVLIP